MYSNCTSLCFYELLIGYFHHSIVCGLSMIGWIACTCNACKENRQFPLKSKQRENFRAKLSLHDQLALACYFPQHYMHENALVKTHEIVSGILQKYKEKPSIFLRKEACSTRRLDFALYYQLFIFFNG